MFYIHNMTTETPRYALEFYRTVPRAGPRPFPGDCIGQKIVLMLPSVVLCVLSM
jgi:hypothetical protein